MKRSLVLLLASFCLLLAVSGCKEISKLMPASTIDNPADGTPEWLVYKAIQSAQQADVEAGWKMIRPYMHSSVIELRTSEESFLNLNYPAFRRKVNFFTPEDGKPVYKLDYTEDVVDGKELKLFVVNEGSDMPAPFRIARDGAANNEWRIKNIP